MEDKKVVKTNTQLPTLIWNAVFSDATVTLVVVAEFGKQLYNYGWSESTWQGLTVLLTCMWLFERYRSRRIKVLLNVEEQKVEVRPEKGFYLKTNSESDVNTILVYSDLNFFGNKFE